MVTMTTEAPNQISAPVHPGRPDLRPSAPGQGAPFGAMPVHSPDRMVHAGAPSATAPAAPPVRTGAPSARTGGAAFGARLGRAFSAVHHGGARLLRTGAHRRPRTDAPVRTTPEPATGTVRTTATRQADPVRTTTRRTKTETETLATQWGKLSTGRSRSTQLALRLLALLIVVSLVGVVVAPPALSAHDIIEWAKSSDTHSGLGLSPAWAWVTFLAMDFAAGVCVLICVYCAIANTKPGVFALYVWAFAGATAYANHSFGNRPNAPGDAGWFFPAMSLVGPLLLHSVLIFLRKRIKGERGNKRGERPNFPIADWLPILGTPQDTYGAWRTGSMLGVETPDAALWAYRAVSVNAGWWKRWMVRSLVRTAQTAVLRTKMADPTLALAIPGLVPDGAFVHLADETTAPVQTAPAAPVQTAPAAPVQGGAGHGGPIAAAPIPSSGAPAAPESRGSAPAAPAAPDSQGSAPAAPGAPGEPSAPEAAPADDGDALNGADQGAPGGKVISLSEAKRESAEAALRSIYDAYGADFTSWADLIAGPNRIALSKIENELHIGKRRVAPAFEHAEQLLPWAEVTAQRSEATA